MRSRVPASALSPRDSGFREAASEPDVACVLEAHLDHAELKAGWDAFYGSVAPRAADVRKADALFARLTGRTRRGRAP